MLDWLQIYHYNARARRALKYFIGDNFMSRSKVYPNRPGNESSSQSLSVIKDTGCLPSPGAMLKISLPVELSQFLLSTFTG